MRTVLIGKRGLKLDVIERIAARLKLAMALLFKLIGRSR
jgi:hypothetical protein